MAWSGRPVGAAPRSESSTPDRWCSKPGRSQPRGQTSKSVSASFCFTLRASRYSVGSGRGPPNTTLATRRATPHVKDCPAMAANHAVLVRRVQSLTRSRHIKAAAAHHAVLVPFIFFHFLCFPFSSLILTPGLLEQA
ncbi:hypothetical protein NDU88_005426 [Pleurodeles waltl]|uniref:Uncharacterized protein n=1 Tax=Pleurodeles waltl TaxID=8319 RepID=A0AAV7UIR0_PLEWA|nr:hypothetical protein NDU88_005426 [Pleurodeles waltl]